MSRRQTPSAGRSELGLLTEIAMPETPPPAWSPIKRTDPVRTPRKWQMHMSHLRLVAKSVLLLVVVAVLYQLLTLMPDASSPVLPSASQDYKPVLITKNWMWNSFTRHDGLTRGTRHFSDCGESGICEAQLPGRIRYDGYRQRHIRGSNPEIIHCIGARGLLLNESDEDAVWAYPGKAKGAVEPSMGSYEASGLDGYISFDRKGRFGSYGLEQFAYSSLAELKEAGKLDWDSVDWGSLQTSCRAANKHRFGSQQDRADSSSHRLALRTEHKDSVTKLVQSGTRGIVRRTAILIRVWTGAVWSADAVLNIRAMITEASLRSGGKYQVFVLLHVKDESVALFTGENQPEETIKANIPPEFRSITEVWNHAQIRGLYSNIAEHAFVGRSPWMIIQWFARRHLDFDFFYQWEFDVRYTGHYLDFFEAVSDFGRKQPRKGIWERAGRVYIPSIHGAFETDFRRYVDAEDPHHIWGPVPVEGVRPRGPIPPHRQEEDAYEWGVGEDADWIGFLPSFNVTDTNWFFKDYLWGYPQGTSTPRRATLIAQARVSRRALDLMNNENSEWGHHMDAEMFPQSVCLHHGLKMTSFPHPIFADRYWPSESLQTIFNGGPFGQAGGFWNSTFSKWNEDAWTNFTWYYSSAQAMLIYQKLLGIATTEGGGPEWEDLNGHVVVRPMLLHPVKGAKSWYWTPQGWQQSGRSI